MKNICKTHESDFTDIVACNDCNMLGGFMLVNKSIGGAIYTQDGKPNLWQSAKQASDYAKKYGMGRSWKPISVFIHFN